MSITVADMMQMEPFSRFRLIAGINGIERPIDTVNILDFEYSPEYAPAEKSKYFEQNALILSSLLFAKGHPELLIKMMDDLIAEQVTALAVKSAIFSEFPTEMIESANNHRFPIFLFGEHDGHFEDIIAYLIDEIKKRDDDRHQEQNILLLTGSSLPRLEVQRLALECIPHLQSPYRLIALFSDNPGTLSWQTIRRVKRTLQVPLLLCMKTLFTTADNENLVFSNMKLQDLCASLGLSFQSCYIGYGNSHDRMDEFDYALKEAMYACDYARSQKKRTILFRDLGLLQILYPYHNDYWMQTYCQQLLQRILDYDASYNSNLLETAQAYIQSDANIAQTADTLHVHKNTVHYRINKLKEILDMEQAPGFYEQLALVIHCHQFFE